MSSISPTICQAAFYKTPPPITSSSFKVNYYYKLYDNNNNNNRPYYICNFSSSRSFTYNWRYSCFKDDKSSSDCNVPKTSGDALPEEQEQNQPNVADTIFSAQPWTVPWTTRTILQVMLLWITSFWLVGSWIIPLIAHISGFRKETLTYRGQAFYSLLTDVAEGIAGIAILHRCLAPFRPLPSDWFKFSIKGKWQLDVGLGCLMFPLVNSLSQVNLNLLPMVPPAPVTVSSVEQSIVARDPVAMALYAVVVSACAPIWEEVIFRGFLLPSLTSKVHACMVFRIGEFFSFCIGTFQFAKNASTCISWYRNGYCFCPVKKFTAIYAVTQPLERICIYRSYEVIFLYTS